MSSDPIQNAYVVLRGEQYLRITYGQESDSGCDELGSCDDCGAAVGQIHVVGCDREECPRCHGQLLSCLCSYNGPADL